MTFKSVIIFSDGNCTHNCKHLEARASEYFLKQNIYNTHPLEYNHEHDKIHLKIWHA